MIATGAAPRVAGDARGTAVGFGLLLVEDFGFLVALGAAVLAGERVGLALGAGVGLGLGFGVGDGVGGTLTTTVGGLTVLSTNVRAPLPEPLEAVKLYECVPTGSVLLVLNTTPAW